MNINTPPRANLTASNQRQRPAPLSNLPSFTPPGRDINRPTPGELTPTGRHESTPFPNTFLNTTTAPQSHTEAARTQLDELRNTRWGDNAAAEAAAALAGRRIDIRPTSLHVDNEGQYVPNRGARENGKHITERDEEAGYQAGTYKKWSPAQNQRIPSDGSSFHINYNPLTKLDVKPDAVIGDQLTLVNDKSGKGGTSILAHEMSHAIKGINGEGIKNRDDEEDRATLGKFSTPVNENAFRAEKFMPQRTGYKGAMVNKTGLPNDSSADPSTSQY